MATDDRLEHFARAHAAGLLRLAAVIAPNGVDAEDLVQECLVRVAPRLGRLADEAAIAYCRRTIANLVTDEHRRRVRWHRVSASLPARVPPRTVEDHAVNRNDVVGLLRSLPARQRSALVLRYWAGLSEREIAETLNCPSGTVKSLISRGLAGLRHEVAARPIQGGSDV